jgi:carbon storage regulator
MLVLSRKKNEEIIINNNIRLVIVEIRGDRARIGIAAPDDVKIFRAEIYDGGRTNGGPTDAV